MSKSTVLVIEDGHEYIENLTRFLGNEFNFVRAGDGPEALTLLQTTVFDAIFLDMKFDRSTRFIGDVDKLRIRFAGDETRASRFLENNQGTYILSAVRQAGHNLPVVFSYDFDSEPRRFQNLKSRHGQLYYLPDTASPAQMSMCLAKAIETGQ